MVKSFIAVQTRHNDLNFFTRHSKTIKWASSCLEIVRKVHLMISGDKGKMSSQKIAYILMGLSYFPIKQHWGNTIGSSPSMISITSKSLHIYLYDNFIHSANLHLHYVLAASCTQGVLTKGYVNLHI